MNTYHIDPRSALAAEAAEEVRAFDADTLIAVRGQDFCVSSRDFPQWVKNRLTPCTHWVNLLEQ